MRILILGGYGVFGGRLARLLSDIAGLEMLICGRSLSRAEVFCLEYEGAATVTPIALDRADTEKCIAEYNPDIVVDASGPFQEYGNDPYIVLKACIDAGVGYLDFADAADFAFGISQFDEAAKKAGIFALSGVSSFPVLTAAVLREMSKDMEITHVTGGIAPSPFAGIGLNVMRAVISYAGSPVKLLRNGRPDHANGLTESMRYTIAAPGRLPLRNIHFSLVDVPDLQVIPLEYKTMQSIWMGAGPVPEILHRMLNILAKARAVFRLPSFGWMSPFFYWVLNLMKFGEHRGGMFVEASGIKDGQQFTKSWHLLAEGDDGPFIPSMAIEAIVRKALKGDFPANGARPATRALELSDYDALFSARRIFSGMRSSAEDTMPLYPKLLGSAYDMLPKQVRNLHTANEPRTWSGEASVKRGTNPLARLVAGIIGFPAATDNVAVSVKLSPHTNGELWERNFGGKLFKSFQYAGEGRNTYLVVERFGLVSVSLALLVKEEQLILVPRRWSIMRIPLPKSLLPSGDSFESERDGKFWFDVTIKAPMIGLIVAYKGHLTPP